MASQSSAEIFETCHIKVKELNKSNVKNLNSIIDELNSLDYEDLRIENEVSQDILNYIVRWIPEGNDHILSKFCHFLNHFVNKLEIIFDTQCLNFLMDFMITTLVSCGTWVLTDVLCAMSSLLRHNALKLEKLHDCLVGSEGILLNLADDKNDVSVQHAALKCLHCLTSRKQGELYLNDYHLINICHTCMTILETKMMDVNDAINCKVILCSLKCLQMLFTWRNVEIENLGELLGILKPLVYCGLPGQVSLVPICLYPTLMTIPTPQSQAHDENNSYNKVHRQKARRNRSKKRHTAKKKEDKTLNENNEVDSDSKFDGPYSKFPYSSASSFQAETFAFTDSVKTSSSDSEFSDVEGSSVLKMKSLQTSLRETAYNTLQAIVKATDKKVMFGYWSSFLPECSGVTGGFYNQNIFTSVLKDPSSQVRLCALGLLTEMLKGSKQFLSLADERTSHSSFTPVCSVLASMISELHRCLLLALVSETSSSLVTQILKCYAILVANVPYTRLNIDLLIKLLKHLRPLLSHRDLQVQVACLTVFGSILNSTHVPDLVTRQIINSSHDAEPSTVLIPSSEFTCSKESSSDIEANKRNNTQQCVLDDSLPWIVFICKNNIMNENSPPPLPVRLESLQVLGIVTGKFFPLLRPFISILEDIVLFCVSATDFTLKLHGAKLLEIIGRCILNDTEKTPSPSSEIKTDLVVFDFWDHILSGPFAECLMNQEQQTLRAVCCDCLSVISPEVFEKIPKKLQFMYLTLLLGLAEDNDHNVRGAAVRCLGVYSLFSCLREDLSFLSDVAKILTEAISDPNFSVRSKASWAMGNLSDALFKRRDECLEFSQEITVSFLHSIGMASVKASEDCDRVRANAVRALGNFLLYLPHSFLGNAEIKIFIKESQIALLSALSANVMKVCWNACYALGNMLKNEHLVTSGLLDLETILESLMSVFSCQNFKVRINAALALSVLPSRKHYGDLFVCACKKLIESLNTAEADVDFKELKHYENLCDQVCFSLSQLACLVQINDLNLLEQSNNEAGEMLLTSMWKFGQRTTENKIFVVCAASEHLSSLADKGQSQKVTQLLSVWQDILNQAKLAFYQEQTA